MGETHNPSGAPGPNRANRRASSTVDNRYRADAMRTIAI
jgi:hypothetical protein